MMKTFNQLEIGDFVYYVNVLYDMYFTVRIYKVSEIKRDGDRNIKSLRFGDKSLLLMSTQGNMSNIGENYYSDLDEFIEKYNENYTYVKGLIRNCEFGLERFKYRALQNIRKVNQKVRNALIRREGVEINYEIFRMNL